MNVKFLIALVMVNVLEANASAAVVSKANSATLWTVLIRLALITASVSMEPVYARKVGKAWIVLRWTETPCNACLTVPPPLDKELLVWSCTSAFALPAGPERTAPSLLAASTVADTDGTFSHHKQ